MPTTIPVSILPRVCRAPMLVAAIAVLGAFSPPYARAQAPADTSNVSFVSDEPPALLELNNRSIVEFRGEYLGYGPAERARAATSRLRSVLRDHPRGDTRVLVETRETQYGSMFLVDGRWVFTVTPSDVDPLREETFEDVVTAARVNLEDAVTASVEQRSVSGLVRSILFSVLASAIYWIALIALIRFVRWLGNRVQQFIEKRTAKLNLPATALINQLDNLARGVVKVAGAIVGIALTNIWLTFVLKQFPYTYPWGDEIDDYLISLGSKVGLAILHAIPNLLMLVVIYLVTRFVVRWVRLFFDAVRDGRLTIPGIDTETAAPAYRLSTLFIWLLAVAIAYPYIPGSQGIAFKGVSVLLGLMLSLGSSNVVSQAASGYMLMFSKALRPGDLVCIGEYEGTVMSLGVLSTKIRTPRDEEINVPNTVIVGTTMKNYSRLNQENGVPVKTSVTIGYDAPWRQVHAMLLEAAKRTPGLRPNPAPRVVQVSLSDFYVEYTLIARLEQVEGRMLVLSALHANIQDMFNEYGVQIMSPHFEGPPDEKVWVPKEKWYEAPATPDGETRTINSQRKENE